jgi:flagellar hook-associated protein 3 FlgL
MTNIGSSFARAPNLLTQNILQSGVSRTSVELLRLQEKISSGREVNRPSDDPIYTSVIAVLDGRIERSDQRLRNIQHAGATLGTLDNALNNATELARESIAIASDQLNTTSDAVTRRNQAVVIQSLLTELQSTANTNYLDIHVFGGSTTSRAPIEEFRGGYRYVGRGDGLRTDIGNELDLPITIGADLAFGSLSTRVEGDVDLNPALTRQTPLEDVRGARQRGVSLGQLNVTIDDGVTPATITVDLSQATTVGDALDILESAIRTQDPLALDGAYPSSGVAGERLSIDAAFGYTITFNDIGAGTTAQDLGLQGFNYVDGDPVNMNANQDLDPAISDRTLLSDLDPAVALTYGDILFRNGDAIGTVTTDPTMTVGQFRAAVAALDLGIRVEINEDGRAIDVINEVSGLTMSVGESGGTAATTLGIRSLSDRTPTSVFNFGKGVQIADGEIDPVTGLPDPNRNRDFRVTLTDGSTFDVDLVEADLVDAGSLLAKINAEAAAAGFGAVFNATLATTGNGIVFEDSSGGAGQTSVSNLNGYAASDLGLLNASFTPGAPATFAAEDRAGVRVDSIFSTLVELRNGLDTNSRIGIQLAGERLEEDVDRIVRARALVGVRASRVDKGEDRVTEARLLDEEIRSGLRDLDYTAAATRFSLLELQRQAGLATASRVTGLSLLDFLG